ncbi:MAG TPA: PD-(D/E)XK nuclease family protein [Longimicrobiales bacterium]|nr:PD-(D/E)XK nuclease family protein [Longimicrobiales bacterium]
MLFARQVGLRDDLISAAARAGHAGWFDPGLALFHDLGERLGDTGREPCGPFERLVLVERSLRGAGDFFTRLRRPDAYVDAADRLFGELTAEGISASDLEGALLRGAPRDGFQRERDRALLAAYRAYERGLLDAGRRDGRDDVADCAAAIAADPDALAARLEGRNELRFVGLQDLAGGWEGLLRRLASVPGLAEVAVQSAVALQLPAGIRPVAAPGANALAERLMSLWSEGPEGAAAPAAADRPARPDALPEVRMFSAHGADREAEEVAVRVRALLDAGTPPDAIAIVARSGRPYTDLALLALERLGVPGTARRRRRLEQIPVVRAVLSLFGAAADGWTRHGLAELAEQPYIGAGLDAVVVNHIGFRRRVTGLGAWAAAHRHLLEEAERRERESEGDDADRRSSMPPPEWARQALDGFERFARLAGELDAERPRSDWLDWLADALASDAWEIGRLIYDVPDGHEELARWDVAGWTGLGRVVDELRAGERLWGRGGEPIAVAEFAAFLRSMLKGDAAIWTPVRSGVRVLEAAAAAYRPFEHVFIVGLESGRWPLPPPASPLLEDGDRERLREAGLPIRTRQEWERRERDLFAVVAGAAARSLTCSWSRVDRRGEPTVPSGFLEDLFAVAPGAPPAEELATRRVLTPGVPLVRDEEGAAHARHAARIEAARRSGEAGPWNGLVEDPELVAWLAERYGPENVWSATSLEGVAKCPWAWFSGRLLRLSRTEDPDADLDPIARGSLYHDAMRRFYEEAGRRAGGPVRLTEADLPWAREAAARAMRDAIEHAAPRDAAALRAVPVALREAKAAELERSLVRYVEWEAELNAQGENPRAWKKYPQLRTGVEAHELAFDDIEVQAGHESLRLRGVIDRVEVGLDPRLPEAARMLAAVDYKSTEYSIPAAGNPAGWDDGVVLQLPLYAAVLEQLRPGAEVARMEYRAIRSRSVKHQLPLVALAKGDAGPVRDAEAERRRRGALQAAEACARQVREGRFPARPAPSCGCPPFCHGWDICRVPGGPSR